MLIKDVRNKIFVINIYRMFKIYINEYVNNVSLTTILIIKAYLINDFKVIKIFIKTNIITESLYKS